MNALRPLIFLFVAASLAACAPRPYVAYLRPAAHGTIVEDMKPVAGVELFLGKFAGTDQPCAVIGEPVPVSSEGGFSWAAVQEHKLADSLLNPVELRGTITALCIRHPEKGLLIGAMLATRQNDPISLRLSCDVARPRSGSEPNIISTTRGQVHYCEASKTD